MEVRLEMSGKDLLIAGGLLLAIVGIINTALYVFGIYVPEVDKHER